MLLPICALVFCRGEIALQMLQDAQIVDRVNIAGDRIGDLAHTSTGEWCLR